MMKTKSLAATLITLTVLTACQDHGTSEANREEPATTPTAPVVDAASSRASQVSQLVALDLATVRGTRRAHCSIDKIDSTPAAAGPVTVKPGQTVVFGGWVAAPGNRVPDDFKLVLSADGVYGVDAKAGNSRPDVARILKADTLANAGFNARVNIGALPQGDYNVSLVMDSDGAIARCDTPAKIVVAEQDIATQ